MSVLYDELRSGKPRSIDDERVADMTNTTLHGKSIDGATHRSVRSPTAETGISLRSVHRYMKSFNLRRHRCETFELPNDPFSVEKLRDVIGLYLNATDKALIPCVDEKSQVQALERTQPLLPMGFGYVEGGTHEYKRCGTATLFAALDIGNGSVLTQCKQRHRHQEFRSFPRHIAASVPTDLDVDVSPNSCSTHKHAKAKAWLAARPRWHRHFMPTHRSWLNLVERFFALITDKGIRRGAFRSVCELVRQVDHFVAHHTADCKPFIGIVTAGSMIARLKRRCARISRAGHEHREAGFRSPESNKATQEC